MSYCIERWLWLTIIVYGLHSKILPEGKEEEEEKSVEEEEEILNGSNTENS